MIWSRVAMAIRTSERSLATLLMAEGLMRFFDPLPKGLLEQDTGASEPARDHTLRHRP